MDKGPSGANRVLHGNFTVDPTFLLICQTFE